MTTKQPNRCDPDGESVILGRELAAAHAAEALWKKSFAGQRSPLPERSYDFWHGDLDLANLAPNPLDEEIRAICRCYAQVDGQNRSAVRRRSAIRDSMSMDQFYTLISFAERTAVFGVREARPDLVADGLTAIAMIDEQRVDFRDIRWCLGLICYAAHRAGGNAEEMCRTAGSLADSNVARFLTDTAEGAAAYRDIHAACYDEVETENGIGFVGWGGSHYRPTLDLKSAILDIAKLITSDLHQPNQVEVATRLPDCWLGNSAQAAGKQILSRVRAGATISARLRPDIHSDHDSQQFMVFLLEAADESDAQSLRDMAAAHGSPHHCTLVAQHSILFCLLVAGPFMVGVAGYETDASLMRFGAGVAAILKRYARE